MGNPSDESLIMLSEFTKAAVTSTGFGPRVPLLGPEQTAKPLA